MPSVFFFSFFFGGGGGGGGGSSYIQCTDRPAMSLIFAANFKITERKKHNYNNNNNSSSNNNNNSNDGDDLYSAPPLATQAQYALYCTKSIV